MGQTRRTARKLLFFLVVAGGLFILACGSDSNATATPAEPAQDANSGSAAYEPVTIRSCATTGSDAKVEASEVEFTYTSPPTRAIGLNQHVTEIMLALGLESSMVGTAYLDDEILPDYRAAYLSVPVLAEQYPSKEVILAAEPDFIYGGFSSAFGDTAAGPQQDLHSLGIGTYLTTAICDESADTMADVYADISNVGRIFGVTGRADALVQSIKDRISSIEAEIDKSGKPLRVFMFDSGDDAPFAAVCCSMFTNLIETVGGKNIFEDVSGRWKTVSWEEVIERDPEVIVFTEAVWSTAQEKIDLLTGNSAYEDITAVKDERFVVLQFSSLVPGIRNAIAIEQLAEGIYPGRY